MTIARLQMHWEEGSHSRMDCLTWEEATLGDMKLRLLDLHQPTFKDSPIWFQSQCDTWQIWVSSHELSTTTSASLCLHTSCHRHLSTLSLHSWHQFWWVLACWQWCNFIPPHREVNVDGQISQVRPWLDYFFCIFTWGIDTFYDDNSETWDFNSLIRI